MTASERNNMVNELEAIDKKIKLNNNMEMLFFGMSLSNLVILFYRIFTDDFFLGIAVNAILTVIFFGIMLAFGHRGRHLYREKYQIIRSGGDS